MGFDKAGRRRRRRPLAIAAAVAVAGLAGCGGGTEHASTPQVLRVGVTLDIANIDLTKAGVTSGIVSQFGDLAYGGLFHYASDGQIQPELATKWRYLDTGRPNQDFEFTLRKDARFSDGSPVTAEAVVAWLRYFSKNGVGYNTFLGPKPRFQAVDHRTVRLHLTVPTPNLPSILSDNGLNVWGFPPSPKALANPTSLATRTDGAGPYMLDPAHTVKGDHYTFVPNPHYYDKAAVKFRQVYIKVISNPSSMLQALRSGQIDVAQGDIATASAAESTGFGVASALAQGVGLFLNSKANPALGDVRVRQALNYALDRKKVVSGLLGKYGKVSSEIITTDANPGLEARYPYDPAKAKQLLAQAGYPNGFKLKILSWNFGGVTGQDLVQAYAKYWDAVGIRTELTPVPLAQWQQDYKSSAAFQSSFNISPTPTRWGIFLGPDAAFNTWGGDDRIYALYRKGLRAADPSAPWKEMWTRFTDQAHFVVLAYYNAIYYYSKAITGVPESVTEARPATPLFTEWDHK